jgi:hypothetical protein
MLPQAVFDLWQFDLEVSAALADKGDVAGGRVLLEAGLDRTRQDLSAGRAWAPVLIRQYELALANFDQKYGRLEEEPCSDP